MMRSRPLFLFIASFPRATARSKAGRDRWICSHFQNGGCTAKERRRAYQQARNAAHLELKKEIDARRLSSENLCTVYISIPPFVRKRCGLTNQLARVKTVIERHEIIDAPYIRRKLAATLRKLFPELEVKGLLTHDKDFDIKMGGKEFIPVNVLGEITQLSDGAHSSLYLEVIPHGLPPEKPPLSDRWRKVQEAAATTAKDSGGQFRMVSFFKFTHVADPSLTSSLLKKVWGILGIVGRVYVAKEGINAQMAVPEETWTDFVDAMNGKWMERGKTVVPDCIIGVYLNVDGTVQRAERPFDALHVRARDKVLSDGLTAALDWGQAGRKLSPEEWHDALKSKPDDAILVDCRNKYETDVGHFDGAEKPNTGTFRETWGWLQKRLKNVKRDAPIMTYCTGGIRCVKVNAYLEQQMGFTNTSRLAGGIVAYARSLEEKGEVQDSFFRGVNHVFDGRMGRTVTDDKLSRCLNCGQPCCIQTDCAYKGCQRPFDTRMFVQCPECAARLRGACSKECYAAITRNKPVTEELVKHEEDEIVPRNPVLYQRNRDKDSVYSELLSTEESDILRELREATERLFPRRCHMLSGPMQGAFLAMLVKLAGCTRVLELGTFTGYSALHMAQALPQNGMLVTCETDREVMALAREFVDKRRGKTASVQLFNMSAMAVLEKYVGPDFEPFDMVFVDANKGGYKEYYDFILANDIVRAKGLIVFDNVLFKGLVAQDWQNSRKNEPQDVINFSEEEQKMIRSRQRSIRKAHKIARKLHEFNEFVRDDVRSEQVLLPVRDGLLVIRRK